MTHSRLLEVSKIEIDRGELIGRDPRKLTGKDFEAEGIELFVPRKAIRAFCMQCCCNQEAEIRKCVSISCPLWPMRMGGLSRSLRAAIKAKEALEKEEDND
jgi:hypothetical protein